MCQSALFCQFSQRCDATLSAGSGSVISHPSSWRGRWSLSDHFWVFHWESMTVSVCLHTRLNRAFTHLFFAFFCFVFSRIGFECFFFTHTANIGPQKSGSYLFSWYVVIFRHVLGKRDPIAMGVRPQRHASHNCIIKNNSWPAHYSFFERRYKDLHIWSCGSERRVQKAIQPESLAIYKVYIAVVSSFKLIFWVLRAGK